MCSLFNAEVTGNARNGVYLYVSLRACLLASIIRTAAAQGCQARLASGQCSLQASQSSVQSSLVRLLHVNALISLSA